MEMQTPQSQPQALSVTLGWSVSSSGCAHETQGAAWGLPGGTRGRGYVILLMDRRVQREIPALVI